MSGDAYYESVKLLLHCNGTNGSTTFTDSELTPKTVVVNGNAQIATAQSKFGGASGYFDGTGDYLSLADNEDWTFGTGDFTVEAWVYLHGSWAAQGAIYSGRPDNTVQPSLFVGITADKKPRFIAASSTSTSIFDQTAASALNTGQWYHIAAVRSGTAFNLYVDGTSVASATSSASLYNPTTRVCVGGDSNANYFYGYIDDFRLTKGAARYTSAFTPPAAEFVEIAGQISGTVLDDAGDPVARIVRAYRRDTGALVGNTTSSAVDGSYSMNFTSLSECTVLCLDDAGGDDFNDLALRVTPA